MENGEFSPFCSFLPFTAPQTPQSLCASSPNLGEQWSDGTGNEFVIRNKNAPQAPQFSIFHFQLSIPFLPFLPFLPFSSDYCTSLRFVCEPLAPQGSKVAKRAVLRTATFCCTKGAYVSELTGPFVQQKPLFRVARFATLLLLWELTDSNRRPSACKADALNQLS